MRIKRLFSAAFVAAMAFTATFWSCAEDGPSNTKQLTGQSFEAWVAKNAPGAVKYGDVYIEFIERGAVDAVRPVIEMSWVSIDYTGRLLDGTVFTTRNEAISKFVGSYALTTHYAPDFVHYSRRGNKFCPGLIEAFHQMRVGDSARVYIPSSGGFPGGVGMGINAAYQGEQGVSEAGFPMIFEMRLRESILDPETAEKQQILQYANDTWGRGNYFPDSLDMVLSRIIKSNPMGDTITRDSGIQVYYEAYFMDGFLARTNWDSVALAHNQYDAELATQGYYQPVGLSLSLLGTGGQFDNEVLYIVPLHMRKGETAEAVVTSFLHFGQEGRSDYKPELLPYQPLRYVIHTLDSISDGLSIE